MKTIQILNDEILKGFLEKNAVYTCLEDEVLHEKILSGKLTVDGNGDIEAITDNGRYWITTEPSITRFNKACDYNVMINYKVHEGSKYNAVLFELYR